MNFGIRLIVVVALLSVIFTQLFLGLDFRHYPGDFIYVVSIPTGLTALGVWLFAGFSRR